MASVEEAEAYVTEASVWLEEAPRWGHTIRERMGDIASIKAAVADALVTVSDIEAVEERSGETVSVLLDLDVYPRDKVMGARRVDVGRDEDHYARAADGVELAAQCGGEVVDVCARECIAL